MTALLGLSILTVAVGRRHCRVELDDEALRVTGALWQRDREYRWDQLLEIGYNAPPVGRFQRLAAAIVPGFIGFTVLVRPSGRTFDVPGPNAPLPVGTLAIFGTEAKESAAESLRAACERHGVVFSERGLMMLEQAPPGSPLREL